MIFILRLTKTATLNFLLISLRLLIVGRKHHLREKLLISHLVHFDLLLVVKEAISYAMRSILPMSQMAMHMLLLHLDDHHHVR